MGGQAPTAISRTIQEKGEAMSGKKRVYVETTVISDATALPARDIVQLGRQVVTREWWASAAQRFEL